MIHENMKVSEKVIALLEEEIERRTKERTQDIRAQMHMLMQMNKSDQLKISKLQEELRSMQFLLGHCKYS